MMLLYSFALAVVLLLTSPVWGVRMLRQGRYREGLGERLGAVPSRLAAYINGRPVVWLHAVSVGETVAATRLVAELEAALPGYAIVISTTTPTGQRVARERFGVDRVFFFPLDFAFAVRAYLRVLNPSLLVLMESELWPRTLAECSSSNIPVAVVNARVSDRSLPRYMTLRMLWRPLLNKISLLLAQSEEDAARWKRIGAQRVEVTGNLKYDADIPAETPLTALLRKHLPPKAKVLICGSTHDGEETLLLDCWRGMLPNTPPAERVMILAPRHPQRADVVEQLAKDRGLAAIRLSLWRLAPDAITPESVLIVDTVGELSSLYALANVAYVGGSLVPHGGQNPLEPAQFGVPVVMGPSYENFRGIVDGMVREQAIRMVTERDVCDVLESLLYGSGDSMGRRGKTFAASMMGATGRTVDALVALLERAR